MQRPTSIPNKINQKRNLITVRRNKYKKRYLSRSKSKTKRLRRFGNVNSGMALFWKLIKDPGPVHRVPTCGPECIFGFVFLRIPRTKDFYDAPPPKNHPPSSGNISQSVKNLTHSGRNIIQSFKNLYYIFAIKYRIFASLI